MAVSARSLVLAGVSVVTTGALVGAPSVPPPPPPQPEVQLTAVGQPLQRQDPLLSILLERPQRLLGSAATPGTITPAPTLVPIPPLVSLADWIDDVYLWGEPWVQWGFEIATDVVSWIPYVGWFAGQIMVFYEFGESIVQSAVFNITDWLRGEGGAIANIVDFGVDLALSFVWLGLDEINYFFPLPPVPLPPRPPLNQPATFASMLAAVAPQNAASDLVNAVYNPISDAISYGVDVLDAVLSPIPLVRIVGNQINLVYDNLAQPIADSLVYDLVDRILNAPLNINSYIGGFFDVAVDTVNALINTANAELNYFFGAPFAAQSDPAAEAAAVSGVSAVPQTIRNSLSLGEPSQSELDAELTELVEAAADVTENTEGTDGSEAGDGSDGSEAGDVAEPEESAPASRTEDDAAADTPPDAPADLGAVAAAEAEPATDTTTATVSKTSETTKADKPDTVNNREKEDTAAASAKDHGTPRADQSDAKDKSATKAKTDNTKDKQGTKDQKDKKHNKDTKDTKDKKDKKDKADAKD